MASNIVKWWKHKIFGGYKQFTVQECSADSEELIYHQLRASSSRSAPPDLLLMGERESKNFSINSPVFNIFATPKTANSTCFTNNTNLKDDLTATTTCTIIADHLKSYETSPSIKSINAINSTKKIHKTMRNKNKSKYEQQKPQLDQQKISSTTALATQQQNIPHHDQNINIRYKKHYSFHENQYFSQQHPVQPLESQNSDYAMLSRKVIKNTTHRKQHRRRIHITNNLNPVMSEPIIAKENLRLEQFTCDVSVEGSKWIRPLQFSFTFYDVDDHNEKITKDDIVGIVYTIYESIGQSVMVKPYDSKSINIRLTVNSDLNTKQDVQTLCGSIERNVKNIQKQTNISPNGQEHIYEHVHEPTIEEHAYESSVVHNGTPLASESTNAQSTHNRHRIYELVITEDEHHDSNTEHYRNATLTVNTNLHTSSLKPSSRSILKSKHNKIKMVQKKPHQKQFEFNYLEKNEILESSNCNCPKIIANIKCVPNQITLNKPAQQQPQKSVLDAAENSMKREKMFDVGSIGPLVLQKTSTLAKKPVFTSNEVYIKQASTRVKMLRKARKKKYQDYCYEVRQCNFSMDNAHFLSELSKRHIKAVPDISSPLNYKTKDDTISFINARNDDKSIIETQKASHCQKTTLNRNELISIIRESMEKNRLCFQLNRKPQVSVSPLRQTNLLLPSQPPAQKSRYVFSPVKIEKVHSTITNKAQYLKSDRVLTEKGIKQNSYKSFNQQRQLSNTVSKLSTLVVNNSYNPPFSSPTSSNIRLANNGSRRHNTTKQLLSSFSHYKNDENRSYNNIKYNNYVQHQNDNISESTNSSHYHPQPHIPIYHQQMPINPAILAAAKQNSLSGQNKLNLCGYDSYLHAAYCDGAEVISSKNVKSSTKIRAVAAALMKSSKKNLIYNKISNNQEKQPTASVQPFLSSTPLNSPLNSSSNKNTFFKSIVSDKIRRNNSCVVSQKQENQFIISKQHNKNHHQNNKSVKAYNTEIKHQQQQEQKSTFNNSYHLLSSFSSSSTLSMNMNKKDIEKIKQQHCSEENKNQIMQENKNILSKTSVAASSFISNHFNSPKTSHHKDVKNYNNMLFARLQEKLHISSCDIKKNEGDNVTIQQQKEKSFCVYKNQRECERKKKYFLNSAGSGDDSLINELLIPYHIATIKYERLICQTSDDELSEKPTTTSSSPFMKLKISPTNDDEQLHPQDIDIRSPELANDLYINKNLQSKNNINKKVNYNRRSDNDNDDDENSNSDHCINNDRGIDDMATLMPKPLTSKNSYNISNGNKLIIAENAVLRNSISSTSSLIHRFVHEHVHHHYHHFKNNKKKKQYDDEIFDGVNITKIQN